MAVAGPSPIRTAESVDHFVLFDQVFLHFRPHVEDRTITAVEREKSMTGIHRIIIFSKAEPRSIAGK